MRQNKRTLCWLGQLLVLRDLTNHVKTRHGGAPGVQKEALRTVFLKLKQVIFGFINELANRAIVGYADGLFNGDELLKQDGVVHETRPSGFYGLKSRKPVCPECGCLGVIFVTWFFHRREGPSQGP